MNEKKKKLYGKSLLRIVLFNVFNPLNILYYTVTVLLIVAGLYQYLFFLIPVVLNVVVGLYLDLRNRNEKSGSSSFDGDLRKIKKPHSIMERSLYKIFILSIASLVILLGVDLLTRFVQGKISTDENTLKHVMEIVGFYVALIPASLLALYTLARFIAVMRLNREGIKVKDGFSLENLSKIDIVCFDKDVATVGETMKIKAIDPLGLFSVDQITQILSNVVSAAKEDGEIIKILKNIATYRPTSTATAYLPFSKENGYMGASFGSKGTYIVGEVSALKLANKLVEYRAEEYTKKGFVVLCLGRSLKQITSYTFNETLEPIALLVLENNMRGSFNDAIKNFKENNIEIKLFSNESDVVLEEYAKSLGIPNAEKHISLLHKSDDEVRILAVKYNIFGDVSPKQKEIIVKTLQSEKKKVMMVGNDNSDLYAMKRADVSIGFSDESYEVRQLSQIVFNESEIYKLDLANAQGKILSSNIVRITSLYLSKMMAGLFIMFVMMFASWLNKNINFPLFVIHVYFLEFIGIGVGAFLILFDNKDEEHNKIIPNVLFNALPAAVVEVAIVLLYFGLYISRNMGYLKYLDFTFNEYTGSLNVPENTSVGLLQVIAMTSISISALYVAKVFQILKPVKKSRWLVVMASAIFTFGILGIEVALSLTLRGENILLQLAFNYVLQFQWVVVAVVSIIAVAAYLLLLKIMEVIKDLLKKDEDEVVEVNENEIKN